MKMSNSKFRRLHPLAVWLSSLATMKDMLIPIILLVLTSLFGGTQDSSFIWKMGIGGILLVFAAVRGGLIWLRYSFAVIDGELRVEHGVFVRTKQFISHERIQTIDLTEGIWHRMFGLVRVQIETAGGSKPEVILTAVTLEEAKWIKEQLVRPNMVDFSTAKEQKLNTKQVLSIGHLLISGATSGTIGVTFAFLFAGIFQLEQILPEFRWFDYMSGLLNWSYIFIIFIIIFLVSWLAAIGGTILKFANFTLIRDGNELHISRGLLERRQLTIPLARIQAIRLVEGVLRGPLGFVTIHVESAGYGTNKGESTVLFPILARKKLQLFLKDFAPQYEEVGEVNFNPLPIKALTGYLIRPSLPMFIFMIPLAVLVPYGSFVFVGLPFVLLYGFWKYKSAGWAREDQILLLKTRLLGQTTAMIPKGRIQWYETQQSPIQFRSGLSSFSAAVASGKRFKLTGLDLQTNHEIFQWLDQKNKF